MLVFNSPKNSKITRNHCRKKIKTDALGRIYVVHSNYNRRFSEFCSIKGLTSTNYITNNTWHVSRSMQSNKSVRIWYPMWKHFGWSYCILCTTIPEILIYYFYSILPIKKYTQSLEKLPCKYGWRYNVLKTTRIFFRWYKLWLKYF